MKRSNGEGTVFYDDKRKRFVYRISYTDPKTGKVRRKAFSSVKSAKAAKAKSKEFLYQLEKFLVVQQSMNLCVWLKYWLENYKKYSTKVKTYERYVGLVKQYLNPFIGNILLQDITTIDLQKHFIFLLKEGGVKRQGIAPRSINSVRRLLISALEEAVSSGYISKNPADRTKPLKVGRTEMHVITREEGNRLIKSALRFSRVSWIIIILALGTGMRISEIYGLEWSNINLKTGELVVRKTVVTTRNGILIQDSTKTTASNRRIPLPGFVIKALKRYALWQKVLHRRLGSKFVQNDFLLSNLNGMPRSPNSFSAHEYKRILEAAGISTKVRVHDLRHTHATWLLEAGVNVKVVSERLGHASIRITLDTYAHVLKTMQEHAVDTLNGIFNEMGTK